MHPNDLSVINTIDALCKVANDNAQEKGFWDEPNPNNGEKIALMHSELSEALEYLRQGNPADDHLPQFEGAVVELADVMIRIFDLCGRHKWPLGDALLAKMKYNKGRPPKHGKKF